MKRKEIIKHINSEVAGWSKGHSVECHKRQANWNGEEITLKQMRKEAQPGELWILTRYHHSKCYVENEDMKEILIQEVTQQTV